jgi:hypothetical protein
MNKSENSFELEAIYAYRNVATSTIDKLLDYCINSPEDQLHSHLSVNTINKLIDANNKVSHLISGK